MEYRNINIILPIATSLLALFVLAKDWDAHKTYWRRSIVLILIILIGIGSLVNNYYKNKSTEERQKKDHETIVSLSQAVKTTNDILDNNTKHFIIAFSDLSQKMNKLQTKIATVRLKEEAIRLKEDLEKTRKALNPPKATLTFTFEKPDINAPAVRSTSLPVIDNIVHVGFSIRNETDIPALDGEITLIICDQCRFASEPPRFKRLAGQKETRRNYAFRRILQKTEHTDMYADVVVPPTISKMEFGIGYRCKNCDIPSPKSNIGVVSLIRK